MNVVLFSGIARLVIAIAGGALLLKLLRDDRLPGRRDFGRASGDRGQFPQQIPVDLLAVVPGEAAQKVPDFRPVAHDDALSEFLDRVRGGAGAVEAACQPVQNHGGRAVELQPE